MIKIKDLNMINNSGTLKWKYIYILEKATKTGKYLSIFVIFFFCLYRAKRDRGKPKKKNMYFIYSRKDNINAITR